jgi:hypothetical protein
MIFMELKKKLNTLEANEMTDSEVTDNEVRW